MVRTIKLLQMVLILSSLLLGGTVSAAVHRDYCPDVSGRGGSGGGNGGGDVPWPWDFAVRFPWEDVQGIWRTEKDGKTIYFMFRRVQAKRVKIKQIDIEKCELVAVGQGYERSKTVMVAQMTNLNGGTYNFTLYAFNEEDSPEPPILSNVGTEQVIVVRMNGINSSELDFTAQMVRISERLEMTCGSEEKKLKF